MPRGGARIAALVSKRLAAQYDDSSEEEYLGSMPIPPIYATASADPPIPHTSASIRYRYEHNGVPLFSVVLNPIHNSQDAGEVHANYREPELIENITLGKILDYVSYKELERFEHSEFADAKQSGAIALEAERQAVVEQLLEKERLKALQIPKQVGRPSRGRGRGRRGRPRGFGGADRASTSAQQSGEVSLDESEAEHATHDKLVPTRGARGRPRGRRGRPRGFGGTRPLDLDRASRSATTSAGQSEIFQDDDQPNAVPIDPIGSDIREQAYHRGRGRPRSSRSRHLTMQDRNMTPLQESRPQSSVGDSENPVETDEFEAQFGAQSEEDIPGVLESIEKDHQVPARYHQLDLSHVISQRRPWDPAQIRGSISSASEGAGQQLLNEFRQAGKPRRKLSPKVVIPPSPHRTDPVSKRRRVSSDRGLSNQAAHHTNGNTMKRANTNSSSESQPELFADSASSPELPSLDDVLAMTSRSTAIVDLGDEVDESEEDYEEIQLGDDGLSDVEVVEVHQPPPRRPAPIKKPAQPRLPVPERIIDHMDFDGELSYRVKYVDVLEDDNHDYIPEEMLRRLDEGLLTAYKTRKNLFEDDDDN